MSGVKGANAGLSHWNYKHGKTNTRLFKIWSGMRERCNRKKHPFYMDYGGRGISVCEEWNEFLPFYNWASENGYKDDLSIDRIDHEKGYSPSNCRWVSMKAQQNNKRSNRLLEYGGETMTISQWAMRTGIGKTTIKERLNGGWSVEEALTKPVRPRTKGYRPSNCEAKMDGGEA